MLTLKKIAITGGVAAGKSTVCQFLRHLGAYTIDADEIVHQLLSSPTLSKQIVDFLGTDVIINGTLSREKIAKKVFDDPKKLESLEKLIHPYVLKEIEKNYKKVRAEKKYPLFVVEMALLFEIGVQKDFDYTVAVIADETLCKKRFTKKAFEKRTKRQLSQDEKAQKADFVITNDGSLKKLKEKVKKLFIDLTKN
jgi:dephospho-CoA kinase